MNTIGTDSPLLGKIICQFLLLGDSMGPGYTLQLLFSEKLQKAKNNFCYQILRKNERSFRAIGILEKFWCMFDQKLKEIKFYLIKIAAYFK